MKPDCPHASGGGVDHVLCGLGWHRGKPSFLTCDGCINNRNRGKMQEAIDAGALVQIRVPTPEERAEAKEARNKVFRGLWHEIHTAALSDLGLTEKKIEDIRRRIPCGPCRPKWDQLRKVDPLPADPREHFPVTWRWHEAVNKELGKPGMPLDEARQRYAGEQQIVNSGESVLDK